MIVSQADVSSMYRFLYCRHVGDLGNIIVDSNLTSFINITDSVISLQGTYSIVNRSLVVSILCRFI